jgi:hypothetical protein
VPFGYAASTWAAFDVEADPHSNCYADEAKRERNA